MLKWFKNKLSKMVRNLLLIERDMDSETDYDLTYFYVEKLSIFICSTSLLDQGFPKGRQVCRYHPFDPVFQTRYFSLPSDVENQRYYSMIRLIFALYKIFFWQAGFLFFFNFLSIPVNDMHKVNKNWNFITKFLSIKPYRPNSFITELSVHTDLYLKLKMVSA